MMATETIRPIRRLLKSDSGSAIIISLLVMMVLSGLGAVVFTTTSSNLKNAGRDRAAGGAMGLSEAGIAQAVAYIRDNGTGLLTCEGPPLYSFCGNDWGYNYPAPGGGGRTVSVGSGRQYKVWIQKVKVYSPATGPGIYKIFSTGTQDPGPGLRTVSTTVRVRPHAYPLAVFGRDYVREAGQTVMENESLMSSGCIGKRDNLEFKTVNADGTPARDLAHPDLVPAAHSTTYITKSNVVSQTDCSPTDSQNIHSSPGGHCNAQLLPNLKFDRDSLGGLVTGTPCGNAANPPDPPFLPDDTSFFDMNKLRSLGYSDPRGLPASRYALLRQTAQTQGNFYDCTTVPPIVPLGGACVAGNLSVFVRPTAKNAVVYIRMDPGKEFSAQPSNFYAPPATDYSEAMCGQRSLLIVVEGGDLRINNTVDLVAAIFVPDGRAIFTGASNIVGTIFAKSLFMSGNGTRFKLKDCFFDNMPGGLMVVSPYDFRQIDR